MIKGDANVLRPWGVQKKIILDEHRTIGCFAGKRGGKTEIGAGKFIKAMEDKFNYIPNGVDPFLGVIAAPTVDMLRRLSWKKFYAYAKPLLPWGYNRSTHEAVWHDGESEVYGISSDNPTRIEGIKANIIWCDEVFQMSEQFFLECKARVADSRGILLCTGSLGVQFINPKQHWAYKYFKENPDPNTICYEWSTKDNPYFPQDELEMLKNNLDPQTFRAMFEIDWNTSAKNAVYADFSEDNIVKNYIYNPNLPTYVSVDWGYAHDMAVGFFQVDKQGVVYLFDEIVESKLTLEKLYAKLMEKTKHYKITNWCCDIAGNQEREQIGKSNVQWFRDKHIHFQSMSSKRSTAILYGIALTRSHIKTVSGLVKLYITDNCPKSIDGMKQYRYLEKDGIIQNENPIKKDDDAVDMIRYFFINFMDESHQKSTSYQL